MKTTTILLFLVLAVNCSIAQIPVVYISFVSHNEPGDNLQTNVNYQAMKTKTIQLADIIDAKGASWNLETCDGFVRGAYNNELNPTVSNVFNTIVSGSYSDNIEIDPRSKVNDTNSYNIADTYHYLTLMNSSPTNTLGGFVYSTEDQSVQPIDWWKYQDTITGKFFPTSKWKAQLMWGAGSYIPHSNDLNDYGIWKPSSVSYTHTLDSFYVHNPANSVWYIGNGCQPIQALDASENISSIINPLRSFIDSIQLGILPQNKFYSYSITINQSQFGTTLFSKISAICDTINNWGVSKIQWMTLTEKFAEFQSWQTSSGLQYSQWNCGEVPLPASLTSSTTVKYSIYPNPTSDNVKINFADNLNHSIEIKDLQGKTIFKSEVNETLEFELIESGIFLIQIDNGAIDRIVKI